MQIVTKTFASLCIAAMAAGAPVAFAQQASNGPGPGPRGGGPGCDFFPAPASVGTEVGISYFGEPPSTVNPSLVGPVQLLRNGQVNIDEGNVTVPLYEGRTLIRDPRKIDRAVDRVVNDARGRPIGIRTTWFILTDTTDRGQADALGLNFAPKLQFTGRSVVDAALNEGGILVFSGGVVDFSPDRIVVPGPADAPFPPAQAQAGSVGDDDYSPIIRITNGGGIIYNASVIAQGVTREQINFPEGNPNYARVHDAALAVDTTELNGETVTMALSQGFTFGRPIWYLTTEASDPIAAAVEHVTFTPRLGRVMLGFDDSFTSAVERIFIALNGPSEGGCENPQRQGLFAALLDGHRPNNVLGGVNTIATDYSPLWDANIFAWTPEAIQAGYRSLENEEFRILTLVQEGFLTGPEGAEFGSSGFIINCPPVLRLL